MKLSLEKIVIIVLAIALIFSLILRPSKPIDMYEDEINNLKENNKNLILSNDSLKSENIKLTEEIKNILITIDSTQLVLDSNQRKIKDLEDAKGNIGNIVNKLNANGVTRELSEYLNRRKK
jgi:regulator of replication initiation timing